jgi:MFS family permease
MKKYFAGIVGNILEHYDQALYGFLVPFLAPLFFPTMNPIYALIAGYALFPLGLISKPLGAIVFGWMSDRIGRTKVLSITLLGMAATTAAMGFLPTYAQAGWLAPSLLALGRLVQNFFAAGENTGGAIYLMEQAKKTHRGWISSLFDMSSIMGVFLASGAAMYWGESWRLLYWAGTVTALAGFAVRTRVMDEKPILDKPKIRELLQEWKPLIAISLVIGYSYGNYYMIVNCFNSFLPMVSQISSQQAMTMNTSMLFLDMLTLPFFGWLTLRIEKEKLMLAALAAGLIFSVPFFMMLDGASAAMAASIRIGLMLIGVCFSAPYHAWAMEQCSPCLRFTVCALGFSIGSRLIGGMMPSLSLWFYHKTNSTGSAAIPVLIAALLALGPLIKSRAAVAKPRSAS